MTTTQLFVELLVSGVGAAMWLSLLLAAFFGYVPRDGFPKLEVGALAILTGVAYPLGIVIDRITYTLFGHLFKGTTSATGQDKGPPRVQAMERYILTTSEALASQIQYNRSRYRVCRAWALNLALAVPAFVIWNVRVQAISAGTCLAVALLGCFVCGVTVWAARALFHDHQNNLRESFEFLSKASASAAGR